LEEVKNIIEEILKNNNLSENFDLQRIKSRWKDIIGNQLYNNTIPSNIYNKTITVFTNHPAWISTLKQFETELLEKINSIFKEKKIEKIIFKFGKIEKDNDKNEIEIKNNDISEKDEKFKSMLINFLNERKQ